MKRFRYSAEQIAFALRQAEMGTPVSEVCRKMGISEQTFYRWKRRYEGMGVAELRRLKVLEQENGKLKQLVADLSLDKSRSRDCRMCCEKVLKPVHLREQVEVLLAIYEVSERRACEVLEFGRYICRYQSMADEQAALRIRLRDLA